MTEQFVRNSGNSWHCVQVSTQNVNRATKREGNNANCLQKKEECLGKHMARQPTIMPNTRGTDCSAEHILHKRLILGSLGLFIYSLLIYFIFSCIYFYPGSYNRLYIASKTKTGKLETEKEKRKIHDMKKIARHLQRTW